jgi:alpha-beta hydrolase superfamily lysophospholipase
VERRVIRRTQSQYPAADGTRLFRRGWLPARPRRALVLVHGLGEHSGRYDHVGAWLAARDCVVHAFDQRGHGRSDGPRGHATAFSQLLDDLEAFLALVRFEHPEIPLVPIGHSLGGLLVASLLCERKPDVLGAVTSAAPLAPPQGARGVRARALGWLRRFAPDFYVPTGIDPAELSRSPEVARGYIEDPMVFHRIRVSFVGELLEAVDRTAAAGFRVAVPMLLLHGEGDRLAPARGSRLFHAQLRGAGHRLRLYPGLRHEILNEPEHEQVLEDVLAWLLEREG